MVETEPEFDADERDSWYALEELELATCPQCGNLMSACADPGGPHGEGYQLRHHVCSVKATGLAARRLFERHHKDAKPDTAGFLPTDGVSIWATLDPEDEAEDPEFWVFLQARNPRGYSTGDGSLPVVAS